jgi:hypothetical protein
MVRAFVYSLHRSAQLSRFPGLEALFHKHIESLSDVHGQTCSWEIAPSVDRLLTRENVGFVVAGTFDIDSESGLPSSIRPRATIDRSLKTFSLSTRLQGCFERNEIFTVSDLLRTPESKLWRISNFGRKCHNEVLELLAELSQLTQTNLTLGMNADAISMISEAVDLRVVYLHTFRRIESLGLPPSTTCILNRLGRRFIADVIELRTAELTTHLSADQIAELGDAIRELKLRFGTFIPEWQRGNIEDLASIFHGDLKPYEDVKASPLDLSLLSLLDGVVDVRTRKITIRFFGWDGQGGTTLEQAGQEFGLTRERVRQIVAKAPLRNGENREQVRRLVRQASSLAATMAPCRAESVEEAMVKAGLTSQPFRLEGLLKAIDMLSLSPCFSLVSCQQGRIVVRENDREIASDVLEEARRRISHFGITNVEYVTGALREKGWRLTAEQVRHLVVLLPGLVWLDGNEHWFWSGAIPRNSLLSRLRKVLVVAREISISSAREAILRDDRMRQLDLPEQVFRQLCSDLPGVCVVRAELICADRLLQEETELTELEQLFVDVLRRHGGVLERDQLRHECCTVAQVNPNTFDRYVFASPILVHHDNSLYGLVGTSCPPIRAVPSSTSTTSSQVQSFVSELDFQPFPPGFDLQGNDQLTADLAVGERVFVWSCACRMLDRASKLGLLNARNPWSIAELTWSEADMAILKRWGIEGVVDLGRLGPRTIEREQFRITGLQALALVFLAFSANTARDSATEGELWPYVHGALGPSIATELFIARGIPKPRLREATEEVCRKLKIRHAFGQEGAMSWMRTVYLQFGITRQGFERLPQWLSGLSKPTVTISDLLDNPDLRSEEFRKAWLVLQELRRGVRDEESARGELGSNRWITFGTLDAVTLAVRGCQRESVTSHDEDLPVATVAAIFEKKRLIWREEEPFFEVVIGGAWPESFPDTEYAIQFGNVHRALVRRDEAGQFSTDRPVVVPVVNRVVPTSILARDNPVPSGQLELTLCNDDDEILLFDLASGDQLDLWDDRLSPRRGYLILCRSDLLVCPDAIRSRRIFSGDWTIHCFPAGLPSDLKVQLEGETLWTLPTKQSVTLRKDPEIEVICSGGSVGYASNIRVISTSNFRVRALHVGRQIVRPPASENSSDLKLELLPDVDYTRVRTSVIVEENASLRRLPARFILKAPVTGAAIENSGRWSPLNGNQILDRADLPNCRLLIRPPLRLHGENVATEDWALLEGPSFCARLRRSSIANVDSVTAGVGQPLTLNKGPYNNDLPSIPIARAVIDSGIIRTVDASDNQHSLQLRYMIQFASDHKVLVWQRSYQVPTTAAPCSWSQKGKSIVLFDAPNDTIAYAVAFRDTWLGSVSVSSEHSDFVELINTTKDWPSLARWLQWWRLPFLYDPLRKAVSRRIQEEPVMTFSAWFVEDRTFANPPMRLSHPNWQIMMRDLFWDWSPNPTQSAEMLCRTGLLSGDPVKDILQGWTCLGELVAMNPVLSAAIVVRGVPILYPTASQTERRLLCMIACNEIADRPRQAADLARVQHSLISEAAYQMKVDRSFIERGLFVEALELYRGKRCPAHNLRVALAVQPFRQWLAIQLIQRHC